MLRAAPKRPLAPNLLPRHRMTSRQKSMGLFRNAGGGIQRAQPARSDEAVCLARSARRRNFGEARRCARDSESRERSFVVGTRRPLGNTEAVAIFELQRSGPEFRKMASGERSVVRGLRGGVRSGGSREG